MTIDAGPDEVLLRVAVVFIALELLRQDPKPSLGIAVLGTLILVLVLARD